MSNPKMTLLTTLMQLMVAQQRSPKETQPGLEGEIKAPLLASVLANNSKLTLELAIELTKLVQKDV